MDATQRAQSNIELRLLGPFRLEIDGSPAAPFRTRKGQSLLALLALQGGRPTERRWIAGMLWPDSQEEQSLCNLRRSLTDLRSALGPAADRICAPSPRSLSIELKSKDLFDVTLFKRLVSTDDRAALERAAALYRGPLLHGSDEHWVFSERIELEGLYASCLESLGARCIDDSKFSAAIAYLEEALSIEPLRESALALLMTANFESGDAVASSQQYRDYRDRLHADRNEAPSPDITALYERIRASKDIDARQNGASSAAARPVSAAGAGKLPRPLTALIGRLENVANTERLLQQCRLVTLIGPGGIGKTRLAIRSADAARGRFKDGVWFADLSGVTQPDQLASFVASVFEIPEDTAELPIDRLVQRLNQRTLLLVLDNCEHVIDSAAHLVETLLNLCPHVSILATSREPLNLPGEHQCSVPALALPNVADDEPGGMPDPDALLEFDAVRLFVERGRAQAPDFELTRANAPFVTEICRKLDGLPLAIELAAARLSVLSPQQIAARLKDRFMLLTGGSKMSWPRHQTLQALITWSHDLLTPSETVLFRRLAIFRGGWTIDDLAALDFGDKDFNASLDDFSLLIDKSLVQADAESEGVRRYRMLDSIREFAIERLREAGEWEQASQLHASYILTIAEQANSAMVTADRERSIRRLSGDMENIRAALEWAVCAKGHAMLAQGLCAALCRFWYFRALYREALQWLERALNTDEDTDPSVLARLYNGAGSMCWVMGRFDASRTYYEKSLAIGRDQGDATSISYSLQNLGLVAMHQGEYPLARSLMEESIALMRTQPDKLVLATPLINLAIIAKDMGEFEYALKLLDESYELCNLVDNQRGVSSVLIVRGNLERRLGRSDSARATFLEAYAIGVEQGEPQTCSVINHNLGEMAAREGDYAAARSYYLSSLNVSRRIDDRRQTATSLHCLGELYRAEGNLSEYKALYLQSAELAIAMNERALMLSLLTNLATMAVSRGDARGVGLIAGAIAAAGDQFGTPLHQELKTEVDQAIQTARDQLGASVYLEAYNEGRAYSLDKALMIALELT